MRRFAVTVRTATGVVVAALFIVAPAAHAADYPANAGTLGAIADGAACAGGPAPGAARDVTFTVFGEPAGAPANVAVTMSFSPQHNWAGDVQATLIAPDATSRLIFGRTGTITANGEGDGSDLTGPYTFSDLAPASPTWWGAAATVGTSAPVAPGSYRASQLGGAGATGANTLITPAFSGLTNVNGTWTLRLVDNCAIITGGVGAASLTVTPIDLIAPAPPNLTSTNPASPANDNSPRIIGNAEAGSTVKLYSTVDCTGPELATGTAANLAAPGVQISVADNTTTAVYATATDAANNVSACSAPRTYQEVTQPAAPNLTSTNPASPANNNTPRVIGTAAPGTTVRLYSSNDCSGTPLATGPAADLAAPGLQITVADNTTTQIRATATQGATNSSPCSPAVSYQELTPKDTTPPKTTITKSPKAKTKSKTATFEFSADEAGVKFDCKLEGKKVKPPLNAFAPCTSPQTYTKLKPGKKTFTVHATDAVGNLGADATFSFTVKKKKK